MGKIRKRQMGEKAITEQFPQYIRDIVTMKKLLLQAAQMTDSFYLVCPLTDETVEKIRSSAYESREKIFRKERRRTARIPTDDPLLSTQYGRRFHYEPLTKREMRICLTKYYGWKEWLENPWGNYARFRKWIINIPDNEMAVWAVNETSMGRAYLVRGILERLGQLDYSKMTEEDLLAQIGYSAAAFLHVKHYSGWEDFLSKYPTDPLPVALVNRLVSKVYPFDFKLPYSEMTFPLPEKADGSLDIPRQVPERPFEEIEDFLSLFIDARDYGPLNRYVFLVSGIYLWYLALEGAREKAEGHPEVEGFLSYHAATDTQIAELCRKLAPKGYAFPDENEAWKKLDMALEKGKKTLEAKYGDILDSGAASTEESLLAGVNEWKSKAADAAIAGLKGQLGNSLLSIVKHDLIDATRKAYRKHEVTESQIDASRVTDEGDTTPFLDTIPDPGSAVEAPMDLRELNLPIDKLTPRELWVLKDVYQGINDGYSFASKRGNSFRDRWSKDYDKNIKAFNRMKVKLKNI